MLLVVLVLELIKRVRLVALLGLVGPSVIGGLNLALRCEVSTSVEISKPFLKSLGHILIRMLNSTSSYKMTTSLSLLLRASRLIVIRGLNPTSTCEVSTSTSINKPFENHLSLL